MSAQKQPDHLLRSLDALELQAFSHSREHGSVAAVDVVGPLLIGSKRGELSTPSSPATHVHLLLAPPVWAAFSAWRCFSRPTAVRNTNLDIPTSRSHWTKWCVALGKAADRSASCRRYWPVEVACWVNE